jgi:hypothetical protein
MARTRKRRVQLPALSEPEFLSLVGKPANRSGFKMVRSDDGQALRIRHRFKRTDQNLLSIDLPEGITRDAAESLMDLFGMQDEYEITERGENAFTLKRVNSDSDATKTVAISLGEGIIAHVAEGAFSRADGNPDYERETKRSGQESYDTYTEEDYGDGYTVARLVFSTTTWETVETVREWLQRNDIDFMENGVEVRDDEIIVSRCETEAEGYRVPVAEGVVGVLELSDKEDIPKSIHKTVLANLLEQAARSDKPSTENDDMTKKIDDVKADETQNAEERQRSDEQQQPAPMTREDIVAIATEAATAAVTAALEARSEPEQKGDEASTTDLLRGLVEKVEALGSSIEGIRKDVDELGDTTVTRSDSDDGTDSQKRDDQPKSIFAGMFG